MSTPERIAQFEKMATADPTNEMAHFSLGNAYLQSGRYAEAATSLEQVVALSPHMSKAYQLCGQAMIGAGWTDKAVEILTRGYTTAALRGDRMVESAIAQLLTSIGRDPPTVERPIQAARDTSGGDPSRGPGTFHCRRTGRLGTQLPAPPMRGVVGQWVFENISAETWKEWIGQGTKVINEMRLDFSRERDQEMYDQQMHEYLGIDEELLASLRTAPATAAASTVPSSTTPSSST
ncbi:MAG: tetratricopeptide repeat protein [Phycisphaerales bacterium]|nr:tetratricopeptide repeat protein [Phycisphaerales bacterium]